MKFLSVAAIASFGAFAGCDSPFTGQLSEDPGPPVLRKVLIQDDGTARARITDLLDKTPPIKCSDTEPCPAGDSASFFPCNLQTGLCPAPRQATELAPAIGLPSTALPGGNQIRLVLNKQLDLSLVTINKDDGGAITGFVLTDPSTIGLYDDKGNEIEADKSWEPTGSSEQTSDVFTSPYGPALVILPKAQMIALTNYEIRLKPAAIKDRTGQALQKDVNGDAVATSYSFTTEGLHPWAGTFMDLRKDANDTVNRVDVGDVIVLKTSVRYDATSLQVIVKKNGQVVETMAGPEFGTDVKKCKPAYDSPTQINVFRVSGEDYADWDEGDYTLTVRAVAIDNHAATFSSDTFGKVAYEEVPFTVAKGADKDAAYIARDQHILPSMCTASGPPDMAGVVVDMAVGDDLAAGGGDMAATGGDMAVGGGDMGAGPLDGGTSD